MAKEKDLVMRWYNDEIERNKVEYNLSVAYILMSIANFYVDDAEEVLKKHQLQVKDLKFFHNKVTSDFDKLLTTYRSMVKKNAEKNFCEDAMKYYEKIDEYVKYLFNQED